LSAYTTPTYTSGKTGIIEAVTSSLAALWRRRWLAVYLVQRELSRSYRKTYLGFLWALLSPLLMIVLLTLIFSEIVGIRFREVTGDSALNFGLFLYCGLIPFLAFQEALSKSVNSIRSNAGLVQKVILPLEVFPLIRSITVLTDLMFGLGMLIIVVAILEYRVNWTILLLPLLIVLQLVFTLGLCYLFAVIGTYVPDVRGFLRSFVRALFFITPIIWPVERLPEYLRFLVDYNPLAFLVIAYRNLVLEGAIPDPEWALKFSIFAVALCAVGFVVFARAKRNFADLI
jgi:ABC-type polysaccharide/polyol phosphate export permease